MTAKQGQVQPRAKILWTEITLRLRYTLPREMHKSITSKRYGRIPELLVTQEALGKLQEEKMKLEHFLS
jgi:hypothetical protein